MQPTILTSIIGLTIFYTLIFNGYKYSSGKWNVSEEKKDKYLLWVKLYGKKMKKALIFFAVIYGIGMILQMLSLI